MGRAAVRAPASAFPARPVVPAKKPGPDAVDVAAASERAQGAAIAGILQQSDIVPGAAIHTGNAPTVTTDDQDSARISTEALVQALVLHRKEPEKHSVAALAAQFSVPPERIGLLGAALEHCVPFSVEQDEEGRLSASPVMPEGAVREADLYAGMGGAGGRG